MSADSGGTNSFRMEADSAAASRGPLAMEASGLGRDFRLGHGQVLHAVRDVSLNLYRGAVVALVGESGSGKSTVAKLLAGQERPSAGTIRLNGEPVQLGSRRAFRRYKSLVQLVFQDPFASLNPIHTVRYHLERPVRLHQQPRSGAEVGKEVTALLEQVRLTPASHYLGKFPADRGSGSRSRGRWPPGRRCCWPTSRCPCWMSRSGLRCSACSMTCASGSSSRCFTLPTTSRRHGTSPTRSWSCMPGRSSSAVRPKS